eukprot:COSAG01_NODE_785_length_13619_cov_42.075222_3_plen_228_part_00
MEWGLARCCRRGVRPRPAAAGYSIAAALLPTAHCLVRLLVAGMVAGFVLAWPSRLQRTRRVLDRYLAAGQYSLQSSHVAGSCRSITVILLGAYGSRLQGCTISHPHRLSRSIQPVLLAGARSFPNQPNLPAEFSCCAETSMCSLLFGRLPLLLNHHLVLVATLTRQSHYPRSEGGRRCAALPRYVECPATTVAYAIPTLGPGAAVRPKSPCASCVALLWQTAPRRAI